MKKPKRKLQDGKIIFSLAITPELHDKLTDIAHIETENNLSMLCRKALAEYANTHHATATSAQ